MLKCSALICLKPIHEQQRGPPRRAVYSISNCAPVIPVDPAPDAATALGARTLEQDRGSQSTTAPRATDEVIGLALGRVAKAPSEISAAWKSVIALMGRLAWTKAVLARSRSSRIGRQGTRMRSAPAGLAKEQSSPLRPWRTRNVDRPRFWV